MVHQNAQRIAQALKTKHFVQQVLPVETNIIIFETNENLSPQAFQDIKQAHDILVFKISSNQVRMVLHLDITEEMVRKTVEVIEAL